MSNRCPREPGALVVVQTAVTLTLLVGRTPRQQPRRSPQRNRYRVVVGQRAIDCLRVGLLAVVLDNARYDQPESLLILTVLYDAARRIDADPVALLEEAARSGAVEPASMLRCFARRPAEQVTLASMGYRGVGEGESFRYERTW